MQCVEKGCEKRPEFSFVWPWGTAAECCSEHRVHVQQKSTNTGHGQITFSVLRPDEKPALQRDERTQLIAAKLSAEAETDEVKARAAALLNSNTELANEVRRLRARATESEAQLTDRKVDVDRLLVERDTALADLHDAQAEVERLKLLVPLA